MPKYFMLMNLYTICYIRKSYARLYWSICITTTFKLRNNDKDYDDNEKRDLANENGYMIMEYETL